MSCLTKHGYFLRANSSLKPRISNKIPNSRLSQSIGTAPAASEASGEVTQPAMAHHKAACLSTRWWRMWETNAVGAQHRKYNKLIPAAVYCAVPSKIVSHKMSKEPPPIPNPESMPVTAPTRKPVITAAPRGYRPIAAGKQMLCGAKGQKL